MTAATKLHARPGHLRLAADLLSTIATVLFAVTATAAIVLAIATHLSPKGQYVVFGHPVMTVLSGSMSPVIQTGDLIIDNPVSRSAAGHLRTGQIISFRAIPGSPVIVTHRIAGTKTVHGVREYITKGDANNAPDAVLQPASDVVGVFKLSIRHGGYVLDALHRPLTLGLLLASPLLWFLAGPLYRLAVDMDKRETRNRSRGRQQQ
jgi:signal peptidase I